MTKKSLTACLILPLFCALVPGAKADSSNDLAGTSSANSSASKGSRTSAEAAQLLSSPNNEFGLHLMKAVSSAEESANPNHNIFISPISSAMALQLLLNGADAGSATYKEMSRALGIEHLDLNTINSSNLALLNLLQSDTNIDISYYEPGQAPVPFTLSIANSAWSNSRGGFHFSPKFLRTAAQSFQAAAETVDFTSTSGLKAINSWASEKTAGKIPTVIDAGTLKNLSFLLMNATYFKANWSNRFYERRTNETDFNRHDGSTVKVQMMADRRYGYVETSEAQVMELPYVAGKASMYVVLPKAGQSSLVATGALNPTFWAKVIQAPKDEADFKLPKFSFKYEVSLNESLKSLGMKTLFTDRAQLNAAGSPQTSVSLIKQDTFVNVDEAGTEAAAVTTIEAVAASAPRPRVYPKMTVDHPFLVSIIENNTGSILFMGWIADPSAH